MRLSFALALGVYDKNQQAGSGRQHRHLETRRFGHVSREFPMQESC